ncbi:glycosyltransferase [Planctomycetes bacterium TBK1r]|uniref:GDP-mannose-dependent alpha-(1-6)-phosphatidylinositol monomannoside mannosyltransferase n=1 Tax=Stieleria magnilauensis TaxID=2527963 RepID=A0ABX5XNF3_9BACT|nr:GDP-mannose-dependent alpha-(1-6)-phosphatidylinositol monomannoside mannosyltransferase [Planctomycetes bacterium TBK1r]
MSSPRILIAKPKPSEVSETFIRLHEQRLEGVQGVVYFQDQIPYLNKSPALRQTFAPRASRKIQRMLSRADWKQEIEDGIEAAIKKSAAGVVLAEYGMAGVKVAAACQRLGIPLVVHFHGYDACSSEILDSVGRGYPAMFRCAAAVIAVSYEMERRLLALGCPAEKLIYCPYGVDVARFVDCSSIETPPTFLSVGRFVDKKAPHLTLLAFEKLVRNDSSARLIMIGDGPLLGSCQDMVLALGIAESVTFMGSQSHEVVAQKMQACRAFVMHSVTAFNGDMEGTPNAVLEAGACGKAVVATRHAGIPDVVVEGETGLLSDERDVCNMAMQMTELVGHPAVAQALGRQAAERVRRYYPLGSSLKRLSTILEAVCSGADLSAVRDKIADSLPPRSSRRLSDTKVVLNRPKFSQG